jgi:hypothetical protein
LLACRRTVSHRFQASVRRISWVPKRVVPDTWSRLLTIRVAATTVKNCRQSSGDDYRDGFNGRLIGRQVAYGDPRPLQQRAIALAAFRARPAAPFSAGGLGMHPYDLTSRPPHGLFRNHLPVGHHAPYIRTWPDGRRVYHCHHHLLTLRVELTEHRAGNSPMIRQTQERRSRHPAQGTGHLLLAVS